MSSQAACTALPTGSAPIASMVVIFLPATAETGVMHARVGAPSTCTVQAPQSAMPQPNFVPVIPSTSRKTHNNGVSLSTSTVRSTPLTLMVVAMVASPSTSPNRAQQVAGLKLLGVLNCFHTQRDALTAADAERDDPAADAVAAHRVQEPRREHGSGRAD